MRWHRAMVQQSMEQQLYPERAADILERASVA